MKRQFPFEFVYQLFSLFIALILVHTLYVTLVRPRAAEVIELERQQLAQDESYVPGRSIYVVIRDFEQEACFVLMVWALAIMGYKGWAAWRERGLLELDLVAVEEGTRILPEDAREYSRRIQGLPPHLQRLLLPRCLLGALHRFATTGNINDVTTTAHALCDAEAERLESELSMIRYIAWAIPSIGFLGTVRGIGQALGLAYQAVEGNISGVTQSLGVAFNSTFVALLLSLVLIFLMHQLQLLQERLVLDTQDYCDEHLIRHLAVQP
jgi:biopolymer transport protein ExbB/TolQ